MNASTDDLLAILKSGKPRTLKGLRNLHAVLEAVANGHCRLVPARSHPLKLQHGRGSDDERLTVGIELLSMPAQKLAPIDPLDGLRISMHDRNAYVGHAFYGGNIAPCDI